MTDQTTNGYIINDIRMSMGLQIGMECAALLKERNWRENQKAIQEKAAEVARSLVSAMSGKLRENIPDIIFMEFFLKHLVIRKIEDNTFDIDLKFEPDKILEITQNYAMRLFAYSFLKNFHEMLVKPEALINFKELSESAIKQLKTSTPDMLRQIKTSLDMLPAWKDKLNHAGIKLPEDRMNELIKMSVESALFPKSPQPEPEHHSPKMAHKTMSTNLPPLPLNYSHQRSHSI